MPNDISDIDDDSAEESHAWRRALGSLSADGGALQPRPRPAFVEQFVAIIRDSPCTTGSAQNYDDARYFIDRAVAKPGLRPEEALSAQSDRLPGVGGCLTATNLAELAGGSHLLPAGTLVQVFALYTRANPGTKVCVFNQPPPRSVVVQITTAATGAGEYNGRILTGASSASPATALVMPAGLTTPAADDALLLNLEEDGLPGHRLLPGSYAVGVIRGVTGETPARAIVIVRGGAGALAGAVTLGAPAEGSESADTGTWARAASGLPLNLYLVSRVVYNEAGDKTLYQFIRQLSFDARGLLASVGAETRVTVDVTESCP